FGCSRRVSFMAARPCSSALAACRLVVLSMLNYTTTWVSLRPPTQSAVMVARPCSPASLARSSSSRVVASLDLLGCPCLPALL
ncbi:hypothetical protein G3M48_003564, partial [Beauveria asiatica]